MVITKMIYKLNNFNSTESEFTSTLTDILLDILPYNSEDARFITDSHEYLDIPYSEYFLIDLRLPKSEPASILAKIIQTPEVRDIPIVVLTLSAKQAEIFRDYGIHADRYITKLLDPN